MGVIINSASSLPISDFPKGNTGIGTGLNKVSGLRTVKRLDKNIMQQMEIGSNNCPMISEVNSLARGIAQGDSKDVVFNSGLLCLYLVPLASGIA